jgi:hypothetical protein
VLRPRDFDDYLEFRVFFGPLEHLDERHVTQVSRRRDGGSTELAFEVDGKPARAAFPVEVHGGRLQPRTAVAQYCRARHRSVTLDADG